MLYKVVVNGFSPRFRQVFRTRIGVERIFPKGSAANMPEDEDMVRFVAEHKGGEAVEGAPLFGKEPVAVVYKQDILKGNDVPNFRRRRHDFVVA